MKVEILDYMVTPLDWRNQSRLMESIDRWNTFDPGFCDLLMMEEMLRKDEASMHVVMLDGEVDGFLLTSVYERGCDNEGRPVGKLLQVDAVGGLGKMMKWLDTALDFLEELQVKNECTAIRGAGRAEWLSVLSGRGQRKIGEIFEWGRGNLKHKQERVDDDKRGSNTEKQ